MISQCAQVVATQNDSIRLRVKSLRGCSRCAQGQGCGGGIFNRLLPERVLEFELRSDRPYTVGDELNIGIVEQNLIKASLLIYLLPLLLMLLFAGIAQQVFSHDGITIACSFVGILLGLFIARFFQSYWISRWQPIVLNKITSKIE